MRNYRAWVDLRAKIARDRDKPPEKCFCCNAYAPLTLQPEIWTTPDNVYRPQWVCEGCAEKWEPKK